MGGIRVVVRKLLLVQDFRHQGLKPMSQQLYCRGSRGLQIHGARFHDPQSAAMVAEWRRSVKRPGIVGEKGLDIFPYGNVMLGMARAATTSDAFNAVAEPRRREILQFLAKGERSVGEIVMRLGFEQPSVSKHLRVLLEVKLVDVRRDGRHMLYRANAEAIRPLHEWTSTFERSWKHQLLQVKERAEKKSQASNKVE